MRRLILAILLAVLLTPVLAAAAGSEGGHEGIPELPNVLTLIFGHDGPLFHWMNVIFALLVATIVSTLSVWASRNPQWIPGPAQNAAEMIVETFDGFFGQILGRDARTYLPFLGTLFVYIFAMNVFALIPGMMSPPAGLRGVYTTGALAICVFLYVQYTGIRRLGIVGYVDHLMGQPRDVIGWVLVPINFVVHVAGEIFKPVSLALRLFGNITGEDALLAVFVGLGVAALSFIHSPVGLPLHLPFMFLAILVSFIQALVFSLLSSVYFLMMLPHEEHAH